MFHEFYLTYFHGNKFDSDVSFKTYGDMKKYSGAVVSCIWPLFYLICIVGKYLPTPNINSGLIQSHKHFWWSYTRGTYIRNHCCVWSFSHLLLYPKKEKWNKTKTMLLLQNAILLPDSKHNTWCLSQFGTGSSIKTLEEER